MIFSLFLFFPLYDLIIDCNNVCFAMISNDDSIDTHCIQICYAHNGKRSIIIRYLFISDLKFSIELFSLIKHVSKSIYS